MGFRPPNLRRLAFEDAAYSGWEVDTRKPTVRAWQRVTTLTDRPGISIDNPDDAEKWAELVELVVGYLQSWNTEGDDGSLLPLSVESVHGLDKDSQRALIEAWIGSLVAVPAPLPTASEDGSPADALPMTPIDQAS